MSNTIASATIELGVDSRKVDEGFARIDGAVTRTGKTLENLGGNATVGFNKIGDGSHNASKKVDVATRNLIGSIERTTAALESGSKSGAKYYETLAQQRGVNVDALKPYLAQLEAVKLKQDATVASSGAAAKAVGNLGGAAQSAGIQIGGFAKSLVFGAAIGLSIQGIIGKIDGAISSMANLKTESEKAGTSVEKLSKLGIAAKQSGSDLESITVALGKLSKGLAGADEETKGAGRALEFLAISAKDSFGKLRDPADVMVDIAVKLDEYGDGIGKTTLAQDLFGKSANQLLPTFKLLAEQGATVAKVTDEQATAAREYERDLKKLDAQKNALFKTVAIALLPSLKDFADVLLESSKKTNVLNGAAKELADDNSIESWANAGAIALAGLIDATHSVSGSFGLVTKGIADAVAKVKVLSSPFVGADQRDKLLADSKSTGEALLAAGDAYRNKDFDATRKALQRKIDLRERARKEGFDFNADSVSKPGKQGAEYSTAKVPKDSTGAKAAKDDYDALNKSLQSRIALAQEEIALGRPLTEAEKELAKIRQGVLEGTVRLSAEQRAGLETDIKKLEVLDKLAKRQELNLKLAQEDASARTSLRQAEEAGIKSYELAQTDAFHAAVKGSQDAVIAAQAEYDQFGLSKSRIAELTQAKLKNTQASFNEGSEGFKAIQKQIDAQDELVDILRKGDVRNEYKAIFDSIDTTAHDAFTSIFTAGKSAFDRLRDTLKAGLLDLLYQLTIKKFIVNISASVLAGAGGAAQAAGDASSVVSTGSNLLSAGSTASSIIGVAQSAGLGVQAGFGALLNGGISEALSGGIAAIASGSSGAIAAGLGTLAGALGPLVLAGVALYKIFGSGGETRFGGGYNYTPGGSVSLAGGPSGGEIGSTQTRAAIKATADTLQDTLKSFGSTALVTGFTAGLESSKNGKGTVFAGGSVNGVGFGTADPTKISLGNATPEEATKALAAELSRSFLEGLQASNLKGTVADYLSSLGDLSKLTPDQLTAGVAQVELFKNLTVALKGLPFDSLKNASLETAVSLGALTGGLASLGTKLGSYYQNFYSDTERSAKTLADVSTALESVGLSVPKTREEFRKLVDVQDLSTEAGRKSYAALINNAEGFASAVASTGSSVEQLTVKVRSLDDIASERKSLQGEYNNLTLTSTQLLAIQRSALDVSNQGLFDNIEAIKAENKLKEETRIADEKALAIGKQRLDLKIQAQEFTDPDAAAKARKKITIDALDPSLRSAQQLVFDLTDAKAAQDKYDQSVKDATTTFANAQAAYAAALSGVSSATQTAASSFAAFGAAVSTAQAGVATARERITQAYVDAKSQQETARKNLTTGYLAASDKVAAAQKTITDLNQQAGDAMLKLATDIRTFLQSLETTDLAGASPAAQKAALDAQFTATATLAKGGDSEAAGRLTGIASSLLALSKDNSATAVDFALDASRIKNTLNDVVNEIDKKASTSASKASDPLIAATKVLSDALNEQRNYALAVIVSGASFTANTNGILSEYQTASARVEMVSSAIAASGASLQTTSDDLIGNFQIAQESLDKAQLELTAANKIKGDLELRQTNTLEQFSAQVASLNSAISALVKAQSELGTATVDKARITSAPPTTVTTRSGTAIASAPDTYTANTDTVGAVIKSAYTSYLHRQPTQADIAYWTNAAINNPGGIYEGIASIDSQIKNSFEGKQGRVESSGSDFGSGLQTNQDGTGLDTTERARILNERQLADIFAASDNPLLEELRLLRIEARSTAVSVSKMSNVLGNASPDGDALQIRAAV